MKNHQIKYSTSDDFVTLIFNRMLPLYRAKKEDTSMIDMHFRLRNNDDTELNRAPFSFGSYLYELLDTYER